MLDKVLVLVRQDLGPFNNREYNNAPPNLKTTQVESKKKPALFKIESLPTNRHLNIYFARLSLSNVKIAEPVSSNLFVGSQIDPKKVYDRPNFKKCRNVLKA